ncbi:MAG: crossover junction endodeoxyribonuclease RuvC [Burkholderiaceae bacterium]
MTGSCILGIDPGLRATGFGLVMHRGTRLSYVASGVIRTGSGAVPERLAIIHRSLAEIIDRYQPDVGVVEKVFLNTNPQSTLLLGQARGVALAALVLGALPVHEYTALQIKKSVTGHGHADKTQIQTMVSHLLTLPAPPATDAADALACAICHAHSAGLTARVSRRTGLRSLRMRAGRVG